jgi:arabinoxylan arabinofuranohydrolase
MKASGQRDAHTAPERAADDNHATLWAAARGSADAWLEMDLGNKRQVSSQEIRFEYAWKSYHFMVESSPDGNQWTTLADHRDKGVTGSPVIVAAPVEARFLRLVFPAIQQGEEPGLFEWIAR